MSSPFYHRDLLVRQLIQLIHQRVDLFVRRLDLALEHRLDVRRPSAASFLCRSNIRSTRATIRSCRVTSAGKVKSIVRKGNRSSLTCRT